MKMGNIYKGPLPYTEGGKADFKGRENESKDLFYLVSNNDFSVCYAESGEGKSSLINAGLCPLLRENGMFPVLVRFGEDVFRKTSPDFDGCIWTIFINEVTDKAATLAKPTPDTSAKLWSLFQTNVLRLNSNETLTPVLIFDQFEEVFTRPADISWTKNFFKWLEDFCLHISSGKSEVKILLSLRSEYVCELDYWSMSQSQCFIPSLKNHRYYLKPLTKKSAYDVLGLGKGLVKGLEDEALLECAKAKRIEHLPEGKTDDDIPCISALLLSLMLSALEEEDEKVTKYIRENMGKRTYEDLLGYVYEKALNTSGVSEECQKILEDSLIDGFGNRKKVAANDLSAIPEEILKSLTDQRIINKVSGYYEISHDSICSVMNERRKDRVDKELKEAEEAKALAESKSKELKENFWINSLSILVLSTYTIIYYFFYPHYRLLVKDIGDDKIEDILDNAFKLTPVIPVILILILIVLIKKLNLKSKGGWLQLFNNNYLVFYLLLFSVFQFIYDSFAYILVESGNGEVSVFCATPKSTIWGYIVIPILTLEMLRRFSKLELSIYRNKLWWYLLFLGGVLFLTCNGYWLWYVNCYFIMGAGLIILILTCFIFEKLNLIKHCFYGIVCSVILICVYCINIGCYIFEGEFRNVEKIENWKTVCVQDENGLYGVLSSKGDTIFPCLFDRISSPNLELTSKYSFKFMEGFQGTDSVLDCWGCLKFEKTENGYTNVKYAFYPWIENWIMNKWRELKDSISNEKFSEENKIKYYALDSYLSLRKKNIDFLKSGLPYTAKDIRSLIMLYSLQMKRTKSIIDTLHVDSLNDEQFCELNKYIARSLLADIMIDVIERKDTIRTLCYPLDFLVTFFPECLQQDLYKRSTLGKVKTYRCFNSNSNVNISFGEMSGKEKYNDTFKISLNSNDLRENKSLAWSKWAKYFALRDASEYAPQSNSNLQRELDLIKELVSLTAKKPLEIEKIQAEIIEIDNIQKARKARESFRSIMDVYFDRIIKNDNLKHSLYASSLLDLFDNLIMMGSGRQYEMVNYVIKSCEIRENMYNGKFDELYKWNTRLKTKNEQWAEYKRKMELNVVLNDLLQKIQNRIEKE